MRILICTSSSPPKVDGVAITLTNTVKTLLNFGHQIKVITSQQNAALTDLIHHQNLNFIITKGMKVPQYPEQYTGNIFHPQCWRQVAQAIQSFKPDIVHLMDTDMINLPATWTCYKLKIPVIASYHTDLIYYAQKYHVPKIFAQLYHRLFKCKSIKKLITTSNSFKQKLKNNYHVNCDDVWQPGINTNIFSPQKTNPTIRDTLSRHKPQQFLCLYVGRFGVEKNIPFLIDLVATVPEATLAIIGSGPYTAWIPKAKQYGYYVSNRPWTQQELAQAYNASDIFIGASSSETYGLTIAEALACGLPAVLSHSQGYEDLIEQEQTGLFFAENNLQDASKAIYRLLNEPKFYQKLKHNLAEKTETFLGKAQSHNWWIFIPKAFGNKVFECVYSVLGWTFRLNKNASLVALNEHFCD
jgi:glycosyltransferase involved in cell wall biosynthesis